MRIACLFPGQGAQSARMGTKLESVPGFDALLKDSQQATGLPLQTWLYESAEQELAKTEVAQPLMFFCGYALFDAFARRVPPKEWVYAGHSLGEYTALAAAGILNPIKTIEVVHARGKLMQAVCPENFGGMAAVLTQSVEDVVAACEEISEIFGEPHALVAANFNSENQVVVSGRAECVNMLRKKEADYGFQKVVPLKVSAPFHSPYMSRMKVEFAPVCDQAIDISGVRDVEGVYIPNVTGECYKLKTLNHAQVHSLLIEQLDHSVRWDVTTRHLSRDFNLGAVIEFGPKAVIGPLVKKALRCPTLLVSCAEDVDSVIDQIESLG